MFNYEIMNETTSPLNPDERQQLEEDYKNKGNYYYGQELDNSSKPSKP